MYPLFDSFRLCGSAETWGAGEWAPRISDGVWLFEYASKAACHWHVSLATKHIQTHCEESSNLRNTCTSALKHILPVADSETCNQLPKAEMMTCYPQSTSGRVDQTAGTKGSRASE